MAVFWPRVGRDQPRRAQVNSYNATNDSSLSEDL